MTAPVHLAPFLAASPLVDFSGAAVAQLAQALRGPAAQDTAKRCFDWVRDQIAHAIDYGRAQIPCAADAVLAAGSALCVGKSHLLVALLRANGIPAGFCYQRLTLDGPHPPFCLHGFVAVWLDGVGWYRCDARGNSKPGIDCQFAPGVASLAYPVQHAGECLYPGVWAEPWPALVAALEQRATAAAYCAAPVDVAPPAPGTGHWCDC